MTTTEAFPPIQLLDEQELRAWRGMLQVHSAVTQELDAEMRAEHGLSLSSYEVLMFLSDAVDERMRSGLTRLIDRLVAHGFVERCACADDGRGAYAQLTDAGREKIHAARRTHLDGVRRLFLHRLSGDDQRALGDVWERVLP
jgi:DNA-binding MarR family transcriptional regulator